MSRPTVAVVGRPNVGKSTLFNLIAGHRIAIEDPTSGVTRDRILHPVRVHGRVFDLVDTGGIGIVDRLDLSEDVERQIDLAIGAADVILFLFDCRDGVTPLDRAVAERLRLLETPLVLAANKADTAPLSYEAAAFAELGLGMPLPVSAHQGRNIDVLLRQIVEALPAPGPLGGDEKIEDDEEDETLRIAFVGKRNAGKSSIINTLAGDERVIVSDRPGTTRDAVDVLFEHREGRFIAIDTAGLRKRGKMDDSIEFYGHVRTERAIRRADVVVLLIDASEPLGKVDKRIGMLIAEEYKPCVLAVNKWDLAREARPGITVEDYHEYFLKTIPALYYAPLAVTSAKTGENVWGLVRTARELDRQARQRVSTGQVNRAVQAALERQRPPAHKGKATKVYYATQTEASPPTFVVFCNVPARIPENYKRYLAAQLREKLGFGEVPLRLEFRTSHGERGQEGRRRS